MTEERRLIMTGIPADEAICICNCLRREGALQEYIEQKEQEHRCKVSGNKEPCKCHSCNQT